MLPGRSRNRVWRQSKFCVCIYAQQNVYTKCTSCLAESQIISLRSAINRRAGQQGENLQQSLYLWNPLCSSNVLLFAELDVCPSLCRMIYAQSLRREDCFSHSFVDGGKFCFLLKSDLLWCHNKHASQSRFNVQLTECDMETCYLKHGHWTLRMTPCLEELKL